MAMSACAHTHTHTLFAMHYSLVSFFLRPVTRDGEQRAERGDFIIPAVFILHPSDFCTSHPTSSSPSSSSFPIPSLHLFSPVPCLDISDLICLQKTPTTLSFILCFTIYHHYSIWSLFFCLSSSPPFPVMFLQWLPLLFFILSPPFFPLHLALVSLLKLSWNKKAES